MRAPGVLTIHISEILGVFSLLKMFDKFCQEVNMQKSRFVWVCLQEAHRFRIMVEINVSSAISWCVITKNRILTTVEVMSESELTSGLWLMGGKWKMVKLGSVSIFTLLT